MALNKIRVPSVSHKSFLHVMRVAQTKDFTGGRYSMKIQWEYDFVEKPFREQLQTMGWTWIEGDVDVPELTERGNFRDVLLKERLGAGVGFNSVPGPPALLRNFGAAAPQALCRRATIA